MRRVLFAAIVLSMTALAGCADEAAPPDEAEETLVDDDLKATKQTGVIRGVVVDPTITPVPEATVVVRGEELETMTAEDGSFGFSDLEPGSYFLEVTKTGYTAVQASATVEAGVDRPPVVKVQISPDESVAPFIQPFQFDGLIQCSWVAFAAALAMCSVPGLVGVDIGDRFLTAMDVNGFPDFVQSELTWKSTQPAGDALAFSVYDGTLTAPRGSEGTDPLVIRGNQSFWEHGVGSAKDGSPMWDDQVAFRVFAGSHPATVPPACLPSTPATNSVCPWGAGVTLQQSFDIFTHIFYNIEPDEEWMFIEDGAYVIPNA